MKKKTYSKSAQQWEKLYKRYVKEYERKQKAISKRHLKIKETKYSLSEFKSEYTALKNELSAKGVKTPHMDIELVKSQLYKWSVKQAEAFRNGLLKKGLSESEVPSVEELRIQGKDALDKYIERIKKEHPDWSTAEIADLVSENIYGSE